MNFLAKLAEYKNSIDALARRRAIDKSIQARNRFPLFDILLQIARWLKAIDARLANIEQTLRLPPPKK